MKLILNRYSTSDNTTLGLLFIDGKFQAYTLEDTYRETKVWGKTRIPEGTYTILLRNEGGMTQRYSKKFGSMHKGMLHLQDVENFKYIYIHYGNYAKDTDGCILTGNNSIQNVTEDGFIGDSVKAYKRIYTQIADAILRNEKVEITIKNLTL